MTVPALTAELHAILRWWMQNAIDHPRGGFIGRMDGSGHVHANAEKGMVLNARILWTFSAAARRFPDQGYQAAADRAFHYLFDHFWDDLHGGFFWTVTAHGEPAQTKKQVYAQAFAIYALSEYYLLTPDTTALDKAREIFALLERFSLDRQENGYFEAFSRDWQPLADLRLSDKDANAAKTMNTHLHVLEAYASLMLLPGQVLVRPALMNLVALFLTRFIHPETAHLQLFFDEHWGSKSTIISFGHDIEGSWLLLEAAERTGDSDLIQRARQAALRLAGRTLSEGIDGDNGLFHEDGLHGLDTDKHWWPQAEAMVGFLNAWEISGNNRFYLAAENSWQFIQTHLLDPTLGEWYGRVDRAGQPMLTDDKVSLWKCPYHNGRACLEGIRRLQHPGSGH